MVIKLAALLASVAMAARPTADLPLDVLLRDPAAARTFDYWRLREGRSSEAVKALDAATRADDDRRGCRTTAEWEVFVGLETAAETASHAQWLVDRTAGANAYLSYRAARANLLAGRKSGAENLDEKIPGYLAEVKTGRTARGAEVLRRMALEQIPMESWSGPWADGLSDGGQRRLYAALEHESCGNTANNATWLKKQLARGGWFTISREGPRVDKAAWLIVQHADHDPAFQQAVLDLLTPLVANGETSAANYAYLYDRVAVNTGQPQRYGTQGGCSGGEWRVKPLEDEPNVDRRRAESGLPPLAEYKAMFRCRR